MSSQEQRRNAGGKRTNGQADTSPGGRQTSAPASSVVRTEGQRLLIAVSGSLRAIAGSVQAGSPQTVSDWRSGAKLPAPAFRASLESVYGIPVDSWDRRPVAERPAEVEAPVEYPRTRARVEGDDVEQGVASSMDDCMMLIRETKAALKEPDLSPSAKAALRDAFVKLLVLRARLEKDAELLEDRIVREHPMWQRLRARIVAALAPFPPAARAVAAALEALEADT